MAIPRIGGAGIGLSLTGALAGPLPQGGSFAPSRGSNAVTLTASECFVIPAGTYLIATGPYTSIQFLDPVSSLWRTVDAAASLQPLAVDSDGGNWRLANVTGCPVAAMVVAAGSGLTNGIGTTATGLTVTASAGGSVWQPVVGGAINSTVTITAGGTGYLFPPILVVDAPPAGGIQATAVCTISGGIVNSVSVVNQGAGYVTAPNITVINDFRDTAGSGCVLTVNATLAASGALTALYPTNQGSPLTSTPTLTFSPASTLNALVIMNYVVTGFTIGSGVSGAGYGNAQPFLVITSGGKAQSAAAANTAGPISDLNMTQPRMAQFAGTSTAGGKIQVSGSVPIDYGFGFQGSGPYGIVLAGGSGLATTVGQVTMTVGGVADTSYIQPI